MKDKTFSIADKKFRRIDVIMLLFCLSGAIASFGMFWFGLFSPASSGHEKPAGFISRKNNVVQRRPADRVLWGRLANNSPVYPGDLILVAESSSATLNISENYININENTLIRIQRRIDNKGPVQIGLDEGIIEIHLDKGSLDLTAGTQGYIPVINTGGAAVTAQAGTVLGVEARADGGVEVQVIEGAAVMSSVNEKTADAPNFVSKEITAGTVIAIDSGGAERLIPGAIVMQPRPNAQFLKNKPEPFSVEFAWNRINLEPDKLLRLEIASDQNFYRTLPPINNLYDTAKAALNAGNWYWRVCLGSTALASGKFTVAEATGPELISPSNGTRAFYRDEPPLLRFQWTERKEALFYLLEISGAPDFKDAPAGRPVNGVFYVDANLMPGTWYWRVLPVFPNTYESGGASGGAYSAVSAFHIEQQPGTALTQAIETPLITAQELIPEQEAAAMPAALPAALPEAALPEAQPEAAPAAPLPEVRLISPASGTRLQGLTALRNQTVFTWEYNGEITRSRFVLSRSSNPLQGRPQVERRNPGRRVSLNRLEAGDWYWNVEVVTPEGRVVRAGQARQLRVSPIPALPAPSNRQPASGRSIGAEELKAQRNISFSWSAVQGANAYIFTLYQETDGRRRKITGTESPVSRTSWVLNNLSILDRGRFIWQVEAVNTSGGRIDQRGRIGENSFIIDIPRPVQAQTEEPLILE
ncbi:MAG: hypothetical protein LBH43_17175 [Treponema sp.]|nr:hypothetical protein [Treponema sp.]